MLIICPLFSDDGVLVEAPLDESQPEVVNSFDDPEVGSMPVDPEEECVHPLFFFYY